MKTKVWIVIWGLKDGGAEVLAREYARLVDRLKFDATIVTMYPFENTANHRRTKEANINVISIFKKRNFFARVTRLLFGKWYIPFILKKMLKKYNPETIHFNSQMACYFVAVKEQLTDKILLYTCHSEVSKHFHDEEAMAVRQLIKDNNLQLIALHEDMKKELNEKFAVKNTVVIRNGVEIDKFRKIDRNKNDILQNTEIPKDSYVVGHIGRFNKVKNHAFLLKVFKEIIERKSNAHLLLVGNGELKDDILRKISEFNLQDRVTILSHRTDIPELLHVMDVMVFPSLYEGLSVTLVEAQASGLKCVISDTINPANWLSENTIPVSLNADAKEWAGIVLNNNIKNTQYDDIEKYDINKEILRLEQLYQQKFIK